MLLPDVASTSARFASALYLKSTSSGQVPISLVHFPVHPRGTFPLRRRSAKPQSSW